MTYPEQRKSGLRAGPRARIPRLGIASLGAAVGALAMALVLTQCVPTARAQSPSGERIVAAGGAVTEILYALGLQDRIVGVDTTSLFPPAALKDKPNVGYVRALSAEGVLSLRPTLVITIPNAGPPDTLKLIGEAGVRIVQTPDDHSAEGVVTKVREVGRLTGSSPDADKLASAIQSQFASLQISRATLDKPRRVLFVLALQNGRPMIGGRNSAADAIIQLAGGVNAATAIEGYKPMTDEAVIAAAPDVILMMDRGNHVASADVFALPSFSTTPAAANKALVIMDGLYLLGFGPRTADAARDLMRAIYPEKAAQLGAPPKP
jgi:iron complex transport system substrate-binding protein